MFFSSPPKLSEATARDAASFAALHAVSFARGWSEEEFEQLLTDKAVLAHRALSGSRLEGFILSRRAAQEAEILSVATALRRRGKGIASQLLALHMGRLAGLDVQALLLEVDETNAAARKLYARAGFREVGRREGYYAARDGRSAALVLRRDLM